MTTESKKPSEQFVLDLARLRAMGRPESDVDIFCGSVARYLDAEAERRAKFEAEVLERLSRLECTTEPPPMPEFAPGPTVELDLGDGLPNIKRYDPEVNEPEPESGEET